MTNGLISRSARLDELKQQRDLETEIFTSAVNDGITTGIRVAIQLAKAAPAVDTVEVKHGFNSKQKTSGDDAFECSICGYEDWDCMTCEPKHHNYCPNCGAKMDLEEN